MKKPRLVLAALVLIIGAASAAGSRVAGGSDQHGERAMVLFKHKSGS
jgi:hypothetical protein